MKIGGDVSGGGGRGRMVNATTVTVMVEGDCKFRWKVNRLEGGK